MRSSANTLDGISSNLACYFEGVSEYNIKAIDKFIESDEILLNLKNKLSSLDDWTEANLDELLTKYRNEMDLSVPKVNQPIRIALTGSTNSPSLGMTLYLFSKQEVLKRIDALIEFVNKARQ
jgi:glutamyl-tRNA synthetase